MTGTWPHTHGVRRNGFMLSDENLMLAEVLSQHGFTCAGFIGSFALEKGFRFAQGFDHWDERFDVELDVKNSDQNQRSAAAVTDAALAWIDEAQPESSFLFVHYFDAHASYAPPEPFASRYARPGGPHTSNLNDIAGLVHAHQERAMNEPPGWAGAMTNGLPRELLRNIDGAPTREDEDLIALYDGEVAYVDTQLGRLLDGLRERGYLDDALVIVTSDHGETFQEHGDLYSHGIWVFDTTVRVPLILCAPGIEPRVIAEPVSTIDVMPTVLELLGIERPSRVEGTSLAPLLAGQPLARGPIFCEATQPPAQHVEEGPWANAQKPRCVRIGRWKYVRAPYLGVEQLFDLQRDPGERMDLVVRDPQIAERELPALRAALDAWDAAAKPLPSPWRREQADAVRRRLAELGYFDPDEQR
jgi:arylsulfatase A-like enzyme